MPPAVGFSNHLRLTTLAFWRLRPVAPGLIPVTFLPTRSTTPELSCPNTAARMGMMDWSGRFMRLLQSSLPEQGRMALEPLLGRFIVRARTLHLPPKPR